jgi:hypothetical protein
MLLPVEIGVYVKGSTEYLEVQPEIVNWRTGGLLKRIATGGIAGGHVNGWVPKGVSALAVPRTTEFIIVAPEGTAITEYQLLRLDAKADRREFRALSMSMIGARSGADRNQVVFEGRRLRSRTFSVALKDLEPGEYGFLPPLASGGGAPAAGAVGKLYTFSVR